ncbi:MAG TPA: DNA alkylation repair protein [Verrucomicrobiae bacterium]
MTLKAIRAQLHAYANPRRAALMQVFFQTAPGGYGAGDKFIGLTVPQVREVVRSGWEVSPSVVLGLLKSPIHEERLLALLIWVRQFSKGDEVRREAIYQSYLEHTRWINNWDLVDASARDIVGAWLADKDRGVLYKLAKSADLWERRIAIIATFYFIREKDSKDTVAISEMLLRDEEDLIHKATGWMLRETGKRDLEVLEGFLRKHCRTMPRTMLRYAIEKLPEVRRRAYLQGKVEK